jgi:hypothetical protein
MSYFRNHRLRFVEFNVENLFVLMDLHQGQNLDLLSERDWQKLSVSTTPNKPLNKLREIARSILNLNPDILMLTEVGGRESLENFNSHFLAGRFEVFLLEGNSSRGIDLGYLVKKSLPFRCEIVSHKDRPIDFLYPHEKLTKETGFDHLRSANLESHRFSRDVLELRIFEETAEPVCISLLVHLKSQLDRGRIDPGGRDRRRAELEMLIKIFAEIESRYDGKVPVLLSGDFNGSAFRGDQSDPEFDAIHRDTHLVDSLEAADVPFDERFTYMQLYSKRPAFNRQLDYIFVPPVLAKRIDRDETWVYRFQNEEGQTLIVPRNLNEKKLLPSDHYPVVLTLKAE